MTVDYRVFGEGAKRGVDLAIKHVNEKGGVLRTRIAVAGEDDKNQPTETAAAVQRLVAQHRVAAVIGSVASKCTLAGAPIAEANGVVMISPTSTSERFTQAGEYVFRVLHRQIPGYRTSQIRSGKP